MLISWTKETLPYTETLHKLAQYYIFPKRVDGSITIHNSPSKSFKQNLPKGYHQISLFFGNKDEVKVLCSKKALFSLEGGYLDTVFMLCSVRRPDLSSLGGRVVGRDGVYVV